MSKTTGIREFRGGLVARLFDKQMKSARKQGKLRARICSRVGLNGQIYGEQNRTVVVVGKGKKRTKKEKSTVRILG